MLFTRGSFLTFLMQHLCSTPLGNMSTLSYSSWVTHQLCSLPPSHAGSEYLRVKPSMWIVLSSVQHPMLASAWKKNEDQGEAKWLAQSPQLISGSVVSRIRPPIQCAFCYFALPQGILGRNLAYMAVIRKNKVIGTNWTMGVLQSEPQDIHSIKINPFFSPKSS